NLYLVLKCNPGRHVDPFGLQELTCPSSTIISWDVVCGSGAGKHYFAGCDICMPNGAINTETQRNYQEAYDNVTCGPATQWCRDGCAKTEPFSGTGTQPTNCDCKETWYGCKITQQFFSASESISCDCPKRLEV